MKLMIEELRRQFGTKEVLRGADFTFQQGRIYGILGRNGAGKTTLFRCLNGDIPVQGGRFCLEEDDGRRRPLTAAELGYVTATPMVPDFLTAREFLRFFLEVNRVPEPREPDEYLDFMRIDREDRGKLMKDFSHGMKGKMQLLVNLLADPTVLLLDEPLTSLDVVAAEEMKQLLRRIRGEHIILLSTHLLDLALDLCDDIVILQGGLLQQVQRQELAEEAYKERILAALREESHD